MTPRHLHDWVVVVTTGWWNRSPRATTVGERGAAGARRRWRDVDVSSYSFTSGEGTANPPRSRSMPADGRFATSASVARSVPPWGRRAFDLVFSLVAILLTVPVFLLVALAVGFSSPGPILYVHRRVGRGGRDFPCLKFRTMRPDADRVLADVLAARPDLATEFARSQKLKDDPRVTGIGRVLRRSSLDELPQFLNVLVGHMSVVGPRPVTRAELHHYGDHSTELLSVRPGITGLWQVSGRNELSYTERVALDLRYVHERRLVTDLAIIGRTVRQLLGVRRTGAY